MIYFYLAIFLSFISQNVYAGGGNSVNNGGDIVALEFTQTARLAISNLKTNNLNSENKKIIARLQTMLSVVQVNSAENLILNGHPVDAINNPLKKTILIDRSGWQLIKKSTTQSRLSFVLHEFLGASGYEDQRYQLSQQLISQLRSTSFESFSAQEYFVKNMSSLHDLFWFYQNFSEAVDTKKFCLDAGELNILTSAFIELADQHRIWFANSNIQLYTKNLNLISVNFKNICLDEKSNVALLNQNSEKGLDLLANIENIFLQ